MIGKPGSIPWLLAHEIRMSWRNAGARGARGLRGGRRRLVLAGVFFLILLASAGVPLAFGLRHLQITVTPTSAIIADLVCAMVFTLMLSQTLIATIEALYQRGDFDLLFSSPVSPRRVMTVRFLTVATGLFGAFGFFVAALLLPSIFAGQWRWFGVFAVLAALAFTASGVGTAMAMALFRLIGPRRTRTVAQVVAAVTGASFFLLSQIRHPGGPRNSVWRDALGFAGRPDASLPPGLDWPLRAMLGEPGPMLALLAGSVLLFLTVNSWLVRRFAADAAAAKGAGAPRRQGRTMASFAAGAWSATLHKELRLLFRDLALISQVLLRVLYLLPVAFIVVRNAGDQAHYALPAGVAALCMLAGQVAASLAWIVVSAEDAPDLLASSPTPLATLHRAKLAAALLPLGVLLAVPLAAIAAHAPLAGAAATAGAAGCALAAALINIWRQQPGKRSEFQRRAKLPWYVTLAIAAVTGLIAFAAFLMALGSFWALAPLVPAGIILLAFRRSDEAIARILRGEA